MKRVYKARVKEKFVYRNGKMRCKYKKGQILEGELDQTGVVKKLVCGGCAFPLSRFDKLTAVIKDVDMTVEKLAAMMGSPSGQRKLLGLS